MDMFVSAAAAAAVMVVEPSFTARAYLRVRKVVIVLQPYGVLHDKQPHDTKDIKPGKELKKNQTGDAKV